MNILDGKELARQVREQLSVDITESGITPGLAAILVGDDPASHIYVNLKKKAAREVGMYFEFIKLPHSVTQETVLKTIAQLNNRNDIHGILVQLPLPKHLDTHALIRSIIPSKDVDGFHPENIELLHSGTPRVISPPHAAILRFLEETGINLEGTKAALVVNSHEFGDPLADLLTMHGVEVANLVKEPNFSAYTTKADIVVVAVGKARLITSHEIKKDAIIIDVGTNKIGDKVVGDVDFESVKDRAGWLTPVPGGVGPMTVAYLLKNTFKLAQHQ